MGLNDTPSAERVHIGFFGCANSGKSSLVNAVTGQPLSVVSNVKGTTTDPVKKSMELLPIGPVTIIDTPGYDDTGELGEKRVAATEKILRNCDIAVLVTMAGREFLQAEKELLSIFEKREIPYLIAANKADLYDGKILQKENIIYTSALNKTGVEDLKNALGKLYKPQKDAVRFVGDIISAGDIVVLVTPIDSAAPKGRLILPQQQAVRDIIDSGATAVVTRETELENTLAALSKKPALVITDSQVFGFVSKAVPDDIPLTSFSILMARYKGFLKTAVGGAKVISRLQNGSKILISEGCTHHRQCDDIGTVKFPKWLKEYTKKELQFEWSSGGGFPSDLSSFDLIIHCGGCMLNANEMKFRMKSAAEQGVPFTNYGTAIAYMQGILERSVEPIPDIDF